MSRRRTRGISLHTKAPREITLLIAAILWLIGFATVFLKAIPSIPQVYGVWALALSGLLLILASLVEGL